MPRRAKKSKLMNLFPNKSLSLEVAVTDDSLLIPPSLDERDCKTSLENRGTGWPRSFVIVKVFRLDAQDTSFQIWVLILLWKSHTPNYLLCGEDSEGEGLGVCDWGGGTRAIVGMREQRLAQGLVLSGGFIHHLQISVESLRPGSPPLPCASSWD